MFARPSFASPFIARPPFARLGGALGLSLFAHAAAMGALAWVLHNQGPAGVSHQKGGLAVTMIKVRLHGGGLGTRPARTAPDAALATRADAVLAAAVTPPKAAAHRAGSSGSDKSLAPQAATPALASIAASTNGMTEQVAQALPSTLPSALNKPSMPPRRSDASADPLGTPASEASKPKAIDIAATGHEAETSVASASDSESNSAPAPAKPATPEARPGAAFASLFAPIISRPIGRGRWRSAPAKATHMNADMQREQALQAIQQNLNARVGTMQRILPAAPLSGRCEVTVDMERRVAELACTNAVDEPRLLAMLSGLVTSGSVSADASRADNNAKLACLQADQQQIVWQDCKQKGLLKLQQADPSVARESVSP